MKSTLSYCRVSALERVRSSFQANASSRSSPARNGRCRSLLVRRRLAKTRVVVGHKRREEGVTLGQGAPAGKPQFLDQAVLQRLVCALDPALGLARIGADDVDVQ